jgi:arsenate reductase
MNSAPDKVLILCTGNSARSILGEYLLREKGRGRFETYSAGSHPTGRINPYAVRVLKELYGIDASAARSKSWDEFKAVNFKIVITVCDNAKESCPIFPGRAIMAHFSSPDPAGVEGSDDEKKAAFVQVAGQIYRRMEALCALSDTELDSMHLAAIGDRFKLSNEQGMKR